jgi:FkbM family methyltransferase
MVDCGANVGYSSAYLLTRSPQAQVISVEPDAGNYEILVKNMAPYGNRVRTIRGAVWSHSTRLTMAATGYRGGEEWARQVRECAPGESEGFPAFGVGDLLREAGWDRIDILKMDIEGAEAVVLAHGYDAWIERVGTLAVELHDDTIFGPASEIVSRATRSFTATRSGELTVYRRPVG